MVTATYGTATFIGQSGKTYSVDLYIADVVATAVKFDAGAGASATSLPFWRVPERCRLVDLAIVTGPTVMTTLVLTANGAPTGQRYRIAQYLNTLATRSPVNVGFEQGTNFGFTEA